MCNRMLWLVVTAVIVATSSAPANGQEWKARHGLNAAQYQQAFDDYAAQGYRLVDVCGYGVGNQDRFAGIWEKRTGPELKARHGLTSGQFQEAFDDYARQGFRLVDVSGYAVGNQERYAGIWEKRTGPEWKARHGLTAQQYQQAFDDYASQGYRLVNVCGYSVGNQDRYAAIWEKGSGPELKARHGLTAQQYQQAFDEYAGEGFRLKRVCGYGVGNQDRYAAIWEKRSGPDWKARHGLTNTQYQQAFDEYAGQGYRLVNVSGYGVGNQDRYAAIWEKID